MTETVTETFNVILQIGKVSPSHRSPITTYSPPPLAGIEGGISISTAKARYLITRAPRSTIFIISFHERPHGKPDLIPIVQRELKVADYTKSILRLQTILRQIPTQYRGAEDIYGRNTSIVHVDDATKLADLHISGSEAGRGIPYPTEEQKVLFDEAVSIVEKWGDPNGPSE